MMRSSGRSLKGASAASFRRAGWRALLDDLYRDSETERGAEPRLALDRETAAHLLHQGLADGQPQARPTELAADGGVRLAEGIEDLPLLLGGCPARCREPQRRCGAARRPGARRPSALVTAMETSPAAVNLTALPSRLTRTWRSRMASPRMVRGVEGSMAAKRRRPFSGPARPAAPPPFPPNHGGRKGADSRRSLPASNFEKSRMSLMIRRSAWPELSTVSR